MTEFTYETPDREGFLRALLVQLKVEGMTDIADILRGSKCEIVHHQQFSRKRWNAYSTEIIFHVPVDKYELAIKEITDEIREGIVGTADNLMPKEAGLDVMSVGLVPSIGPTPLEESLISDLERSTEILSQELIEEILPEDVKEKGQDMADAYVYLYCVENALRLFVDKIARENYGADHFPNLITNREIDHKLRVRRRDEQRNQWLRIRGDSEIFYLDFDDLGSIIRNNWDIFRSYFPSQEWIVTKIEELSKCRNLVAHNSYIGQEERDLIRVYFNSILRQIGSSA